MDGVEKEYAIYRMRCGFVTRDQLASILKCGDRQARLFMQEVKKQFPVISSSKIKGYKIASTASDLALVEQSIRDNRAKAISIFEGQKKLKDFMKSYHKDMEQLTFDF
jgi:hypothetical protein